MGFGLRISPAAEAVRPGGFLPPGPGPGGSGQPFVALQAGPGPGPKKLVYMMRSNSFVSDNGFNTKNNHITS